MEDAYDFKEDDDSDIEPKFRSLKMDRRKNLVEEENISPIVRKRGRGRGRGSKLKNDLFCRGILTLFCLWMLNFRFVIIKKNFLSINTIC